MCDQIIARIMWWPTIRKLERWKAVKPIKVLRIILLGPEGRVGGYMGLRWYTGKQETIVFLRQRRGWQNFFSTMKIYRRTRYRTGILMPVNRIFPPAGCTTHQNTPLYREMRSEEHTSELQSR